jgi:hypothetical protein
MMLYHRWLLTLLIAVAIFGTTTRLLARPAHKRALADHFGPFLPKKLNDCRTCHLPDPPGTKPSDDEKPHNAFGARLKAVRKELRKAGKSTTLIDRIMAIADEDSDGDGVPNLVELLTGHNPGDKDDRPTEAELVKAKDLVLAFVKSRNSYPWRPFERVQRPALPIVNNSAWVKNPIDAFIAAEHEALSLKPRPPAAKEVLLRRVYIDLTGLPPTPAELHAFLSDTSPDAYEKVVDRLLASPRYGERWGRHWMDVWRYSDWAGFGPQVRDSKPYIWRWRDWIIESLNQDRGYDRMVLEMLAADELVPGDNQALRATGYLVRNYKLLSREKWMEDAVEHTAQAFLGITLKCARCHDHMYDPFTQKEYYQFRAIFEPYNVRDDPLPGEPDVKKDALVRVFDKDLAVLTYLFVRGDDRNPDKSKALPAAVPDSLGGDAYHVEPVNLPAVAYCPDRRDYVLRDLLTASTTELHKARAALEKVAAKGGPEMKLTELDLQLAEAKHQSLLAVLAAEQMEYEGRKDSAPWKQAALDAAAAQRQVALLQARRPVFAAEKALAEAKPPMRATAKAGLAKAQQALAKVEAEARKPLTPKFQPRPVTVYPKTSTGRRLALARWLIDRNNPLTARVAVNHLWLRHFGQGIVPTTFDFGRNGRPPSHPALLDWLAAEFLDNGWSMKHLHRLMVTSSTYRQASTPDAADMNIDPDNKYLWRFTPRRAEAEVVRDSIYYVAGRLNLTMGGPEISYTQGMAVPRRSLYFQNAAEKQMPFMEIFDGPSVVECYERKQAIMPQQALALHNNDLVRRHARLLARQLSAQCKDNAEFITLAFEQVLTRRPNSAELAECSGFLEKMTKDHGAAKQAPGAADAEGRTPSPDPAIRAREQLVHVLMNHHEFVTIR